MDPGLGIYKEEVTTELRIFGIVIKKTRDIYECEEREGKQKTMGFRK